MVLPIMFSMAGMTLANVAVIGVARQSSHRGHKLAARRATSGPMRLALANALTTTVAPRCQIHFRDGQTSSGQRSVSPLCAAGGLWASRWTRPQRERVALITNTLIDPGDAALHLDFIIHQD